MNWEAIRNIENRIKKNKLRLKAEKDHKIKGRLRLKITIDEYRLRLERLS
jgi:hypothetical protein